MTLGAREPLDVSGAVDYVHSRPDVDVNRVAVQGVSLGASSGIIAMAGDPRIAAIVAESPFSDMQGVIARSFERYTGLPSFPFAPVTTFIIERRLHADAADIRPLDAITRIGQRPVFVIEDLDDAAMPPRSGRRIHAAALGPKELWLVEHAGHSKAYKLAPEEYKRRVLAFYGAHLRGDLVAAAPGAAAGFAGDDSISTEELAVRLLPYLLTEADLPAYRPAGVEVDTSATQALKETPPGGDAWAAFERTRRRFMLQVHQILRPTDGVVPPAIFTIGVMASVEAAEAEVGLTRPPSTNAMRLPLDQVIGEARAAWRFPADQLGQPPREVTDIRWLRGRLVFSVQRTTLPDATGMDDLSALAARADAYIVALPPLDLKRTVALPATEAQRLAMLLRLQTLRIDAEAAPAGFRPAESGTTHPAQGVLNLVLLNPGFGAGAALQRYAEIWRRVYTAGFWFTRDPDGAPRLIAVAAVDADVEAARDDVRDPVAAVFGLARPDTKSAPPPIQLGDETTFFLFDLGPLTGGEAVESMALRWRHGTVVLSAESIGRAGAVTEDQLAGFARAIEAAYQTSALALSP